MIRLVDRKVEENKVVYHFEDKEAKEKYKLSQETIIAKSVQFNNSSFINGMLGIAWDSVDAI